MNRGGFSVYWSCSYKREATLSLNILWHCLSSLLLLLIPLPHELPSLSLHISNKHLPHVLCSGPSLCQAHTSDTILVLSLSFLKSVFKYNFVCRHCLNILHKNNNSYHSPLLPGFLFKIHASEHLSSSGIICNVVVWIASFKWLWEPIIL